MAINKNINDDITLAYLLKKVKTDVLSVLNAAVEKIYVALGNKVDKAGDTMTGNLEIENTSPGTILKNTAMDVTNSSYASPTNSMGFRLRDKNGKNVAIITDRYLANGSTGLWLSGWKTVNGTAISNILGLYVDKDGNRVVDLYPVPWREALGLGTSGAFPITVAQGGSGQTGITTTTIASSIIAAASGITIINASYAQWGKVAQIYVRWKSANTVSVAADGNATNVTVGTIASGKRPAINSTGESFGDGAGPAFYYLETGGALKLCACGGTGSLRTIAAGAEFYCGATYLLP